MNVFESGHYLLGKNIHIGQKANRKRICLLLFERKCIAYAVDKGVSLKFVCVHEQFLLPRIHYLYVVQNWTGASLQLRLMWGVFKRKWLLSLFNDIPLQGTSSPILTSIQICPIGDISYACCYFAFLNGWKNVPPGKCFEFEYLKRVHSSS